VRAASRIERLRWREAQIVTNVALVMQANVGVPKTRGAGLHARGIEGGRIGSASDSEEAVKERSLCPRAPGSRRKRIARCDALNIRRTSDGDWCENEIAELHPVVVFGMNARNDFEAIHRSLCSNIGLRATNVIDDITATRRGVLTSAGRRIAAFAHRRVPASARRGIHVTSVDYINPSTGEQHRHHHRSHHPAIVSRPGGSR
jgi:hypothetical protein